MTCTAIFAEMLSPQEIEAARASCDAVGAFTPNFVGAAIATAWQAKFAGLAARQAAEQTPIRARTNEVLSASVRELELSLQANPRFARLAQLGMSHGCEPPVDAPR